MKKRVIALVGAVLLVASMSMTALAANPSVQAGVVTGIESATDKDGQKIETAGASAKIIIDTFVAANHAAEVPKIKETNTLKDVLGDKYQAGMKVADMKEVKVVGDEQAVKSLFPVTITFKVNGVKATDTVYVLHHTGTAWENLGGKAGNGTITATFSSLSPVAFVIKDAGTSPKTGETSMMMWAVAAVVLGATGIVTFKKKA